MTPEETIRLAAVDVRERPEDDADAIDDALANFDPLLARIAELERERDEAVAWVHTITSAGLYDGDALDAFLAKHPQPAKEQVE
jgi:hypothetical protein